LVLASGGSGAFYYYIELPMRADLSARQFQLTALHGDIAKGNATARKLPEFRSQVADLEARLDNLKAVLPDEKGVAPRSPSNCTRSGRSPSSSQGRTTTSRCSSTGSGSSPAS
jgi:hypothetical protein